MAARLAKELLVRKYIHRSDIEETIHITNAGIKHIIQNLHSYDEERLQVLFEIEAGLQSGEYLGHKPPGSGKHGAVRYFHYFRFQPTCCHTAYVIDVREFKQKSLPWSVYDLHHDTSNS